MRLAGARRLSCKAVIRIVAEQHRDQALARRDVVPGEAALALAGPALAELSSRQRRE